MHPLVREVQKSQIKPIPAIKPGYTIRVSQKVKEGNKERIQAFEGLVIKVSHGEGVERTITVRKMVEGIGVEKVFPIHSSTITKIEVKKKAKVRRSKLYYMRKRFGKSARLQERHVTDAERAAENAKMQDMIDEAVKAQAEKEKAGASDADEKADDTSSTKDTQVVEQDAPTEEAKEEPTKDSEAPDVSEASSTEDAPSDEPKADEEEK